MNSRRWLILTLTLIFALGGLTYAESNEEQTWGPNLLKNNPAVKIYRENQNGVVEFVEGALSVPVRPGDESRSAILFFENHRGSFRMTNPSEELTLTRSKEDELGMKHLRFSQLYRGLKVIGGELIAHFTKAGVLKTINGNFEPGIDLEINPSISAATATQTAYDDLANFFGKTNPGEAELVVFPWEGTYYLCWHLFLLSDTPMGRWEYFVDAKTGEVVYKANRIKSTPAIGTGPGVMGEARTHIDTDYTGSIYQMKDFTRQALNNPHGHDGQMPAGNYLQANIAGSSLPGSIATDADNVWNATTQAPAVDGQVYSALVYDWWLSVFNRNSYNAAGASMLTVVNYSGEGDNNAYWDGSRIVVWSFSSGWRSLAGCPDVIAHEWGHAVTDFESNLVYQKEPGALNESFSDMMGAAFEWAHDSMDVPDWNMGENGRITGVPFRSMSDPHLYSDPDYYGTSDPYWVDVVNCSPSGLNDYCGVHTNSGVGNKWFYLLSVGGVHHGVTVTGIEVENAMKIAYRANANYWTSSTDYYNGALGTISAANDLDTSGAWAIQVVNAWTAVGVPVPGPSLAFTYPNGTPTLITPNQATTVPVVVSGTLGGVPVSGTGHLYYSVDGGIYTNVVMTETSPNHYNATLPALSCNSRLRYYFSAQEAATGIKYSPDPTQPFEAVSATASSFVLNDNFQSDLGWTVSGNATTGMWQRGVPVGGGDRGDPPTDYDGSGQCYLTQNTDGDSDIDNGTVWLTSPTFDLSAGDAQISYGRWYSNDYGADPHNDIFKVYISSDNGSNWSVVETVGPVNEASGGWYLHSFWANDFALLSNQMKLRFEASDLNDGSVVEAGVDAVKITVYECGNVPRITTTALPDWTQGVPYSQQLQATGGTGELTWSDLTGGLVGSGLTLSSSGLLFGVPTGMTPVTFTARVVDDSSASDQKVLSFNVNPLLVITTASLPDWTVNRPYSQQLQATGGTGTRVWTDKNSQLAGTGLALSSSGQLTGTPTAVSTISFTARVADQVGDTEEQPFTFAINPAVAIATEALPDAIQGDPYSQQLASSGGTGSKTWSDKNGNLQGTGLALSSSGLLSGTPNSEGEISFTARVVDVAGSAAEKLLNLTVLPPFMCGDADGSRNVDVSDVVYLIAYVFGTGPAPEPLATGDADCSGTVDVSDAVYLITYIFGGGGVPCANCP